MASVKRRRFMGIDDVLEAMEENNNENSVVYDSSESELEDDEHVASFPEKLALDENTSGDGISTNQEDTCSSSDSDAETNNCDLHQRQQTSSRLDRCAATSNSQTGGKIRGRAATRNKRVRCSRDQTARQDGSQLYKWSSQVTKRTLKQFTSSVGPTRRGRREETTALEYFELFLIKKFGISWSLGQI